ncbi:CotS family spore coat protein [Paenibacillus puerhi]|uniref:CotS family spore coat protein n=1 Tax=Paenibacillus puerhi TaxID=2692622 RepID=UPI00135A4E5D|nr:CotS family spore coat protein [Paenibacillus puerhi]
MEKYQIGPWDHLTDTLPPGIVLEQYVPPELEELAREVSAQYDMQVYDMTLITSKPDKGGAIWKINTNHGPRSLKVLHRGPARSLFSIGAQDYLVKQGARVPALIANLDGQQYVEAGGKLWIVTEWIEPLSPVSKIDLEGAAALCKGLGEFHKKSQGYEPPFGAASSSRLYRWPKYYEKIIAKIGWFRDICLAYNEYPASASLLSVIDQFEQQARDIFDRFKQSPYYRMTAMGEPYFGLAHQDYGWSNGQMGPDGIWVIDLDGVSYDLPIRDLRKLMTSTMDDMGNWDITWLRGMIAAYHEGNPLDRETYEILWLDMAFPNEFYKHIKEIVFEPSLFLQTELEGILQRVITGEATKWQVLHELELDKENYAPGNYSELVETKPSWMERVLDSGKLAMPGLFAAVPEEQSAQIPSEMYPVYSEGGEALTPETVAESSLIAAPLAAEGWQAQLPDQERISAGEARSEPVQQLAGLPQELPAQPPAETPIVVPLPSIAAPAPARAARRRRKRTIRITKPQLAKSSRRRSKPNRKKKISAKRTTSPQLNRKTKVTKIIKRTARVIRPGRKSGSAAKHPVKAMSGRAGQTKGAARILPKSAARPKTDAGKTKQRKRTA